MPRTRDRNTYTYAQFLEAITPDEFAAISELAETTPPTEQSRRARLFWERIKAGNEVNFNKPWVVGAFTWLVVNTQAWTVDRAQELAG